jgi:hypothetical protein
VKEPNGWPLTATVSNSRIAPIAITSKRITTALESASRVQPAPVITPTRPRYEEAILMSFIGRWPIPPTPRPSDGRHDCVARPGADTVSLDDLRDTLENEFDANIEERRLPNYRWREDGITEDLLQIIHMKLSTMSYDQHRTKVELRVDPRKLSGPSEYDHGDISLLNAMHRSNGTKRLSSA